MERNERKQKFIEIAGLVENSGSLYAKYLLDPTHTSYFEQIVNIETQGDYIQDELNQYFTSQRNIPYLSLDRAKLLRHLDEVLDQILLASKHIQTFGGSLPDDFSERGKELANGVTRITSTLNEAVVVIYDDFGKASDLTYEIEDIRDEATAFLFDLEKTYFQLEETGNNWKVFTAVSRVSRRTMGIINSTKSAGEVLQLMTMKYI